ncbi:MAG: hypothetical protein RQ866_04635 [Bacteroidales bacterium]|nr:hypothetical protein [Bacteroidales bacterium]
MKKVLLMLVMITAIACFSYAQNPELLSKKGVPILPQQGDIAIGINAMPVLNYFGNVMNGTTNNSTAFGFLNPMQAIYGKYYMQENTAIRGWLRVGQEMTNDVVFIQDDLNPTDPEEQVEDKYSYAESNIVFGIGLEKRRGISRVQGFYGGELLLLVNTTSDKYSYGNEFSSTNITPNRTNFGYNNPAENVWTTKEANGLMVGAGVRAFIGVEYFFAPKMSLGGEFGWGLIAGTQMAGKRTLEYWNVPDDKVEEVTLKNGKGSGIILDTDNAMGIIKLLFHF